MPVRTSSTRASRSAGRSEAGGARPKVNARPPDARARRGLRPGTCRAPSRDVRTALLALTFVALASARASAADEAASPFEAKPTALFAVLGLGTPVGFMGAEVE